MSPSLDSDRRCVVCGTVENLKPGGYKCLRHEAQFPTLPISGTCTMCQKNPVDLGKSALCDECAEFKRQAMEDLEDYLDHQDTVASLAPIP